MVTVSTCSRPVAPSTRLKLTEAVYQTVRKIYSFRLNSADVPAFVWNSEALHPDPDYMTGYCGIYGFLLRFCDPTLSRPLSFEIQ